MAGRSCTTTPPAIRASGRRALRRAAVALAAAVVAGCHRGPPDGIALVGATVIDGRGGAPQKDMVVVTRGHLIESVAPRDGFKIPRHTRKVDVSGKFVLPGFIDAHGHVERWALSRYLAYGVTSVRDVHGTLDSIMDLREKASLNAFTSPRIYSAGAMIDGAPATYPNAIEVHDNSEARKAVDRLAVKGVDYLKVYTRVTPQVLRAVVDEANSFGLRVAAHLGLTDALTASDIGVRSIEHMSGVPEAAGDAAPLYAAHAKSFFAGWTAFEKSWAGLDSAALDRVAKHLVSKNVILVPTLALHELYSRLDDPTVQQAPWLGAVPKAARDRWNVPDMIARAGWGPGDFAAFRRSRPNQDLFVREFLRAGGVIAAGTDASNQMLVPGFSEHQEMELLVRAGLTPADAVLAATHDAAVLLGADSIGVVAPGKAADLIVLGRNPLDNIQNTQSIERVIVRGQLFAVDSIRRSW